MKTSSILMTVAAIAAVAMCLQGCIPPQMVIDAGETTDKTGEVLVAGSLITTIEKMMAVDEEIEKGGGTPTLTHEQWAEIINIKAAQVSSVDIMVVREKDGVVAYHGDSPVVGGSFNILIRGLEADTYILTLGFGGNSLDPWVFSSTDKVDVLPQTTTNAMVTAYLNNYCQKQIRVIGLDAAIAEIAIPTLIVNHPDGGFFTIVGEGLWFPGEPNVINVVFRNNLTFDVPQPMTLAFMNEEGRQLAAMQLEFDPVAIAHPDLAVTFIPIYLGDLSVTVHTAPPMGVVY